MYISRNLEQWNAFLDMLKTAFEQGKAQDVFRKHCGWCGLYRLIPTLFNQSSLMY